MWIGDLPPHSIETLLGCSHRAGQEVSGGLFKMSFLSPSSPVAPVQIALHHTSPLKTNAGRHRFRLYTYVKCATQSILAD